MYRKTIVLIALVGAAVALAGAGDTATVATAATTPAVAEPYWRCPNGFAFATVGLAVHCKKASWTETKPYMPCLVPTPDLKYDLVGTTDMCSGSIGVAVTAEPVCYPTDIANGFTKRKVAGRDFCGKYHPPQVIAPNQLITL